MTKPYSYHTSKNEWRHNKIGGKWDTFTNEDAGKPKPCSPSICKACRELNWYFLEFRLQYMLKFPSLIPIPMPPLQRVFNSHSYSQIFVKIIPIPIPIPQPCFKQCANSVPQTNFCTSNYRMMTDHGFTLNFLFESSADLLYIWSRTRPSLNSRSKESSLVRSDVTLALASPLYISLLNPFLIPSLSWLVLSQLCHSYSNMFTKMLEKKTIMILLR